METVRDLDCEGESVVETLAKVGMAQLYTFNARKDEKGNSGTNMCSSIDDSTPSGLPRTVRAGESICPRPYKVVSQHSRHLLGAGRWTLVWPLDSEQKFGVHGAVPITASKTSFLRGVAAVDVLFSWKCYLIVSPHRLSLRNLHLTYNLRDRNRCSKWLETPRASAAAQTARTMLARCNAPTARSWARRATSARKTASSVTG